MHKCVNHKTQTLPTSQLFDRLWGGIIGGLDMKAENIYKSVFDDAVGDWADVEGTPDGNFLRRWVPAITRGDVFKSRLDDADAPGLAAAVRSSTTPAPILSLIHI